MKAKQPDIVLLFQLWNKTKLPKAEIARRLGVNIHKLARLVEQHKLPTRPNFNSTRPKIDNITPEELQLRIQMVKAESLRQKKECGRPCYEQRTPKTFVMTNPRNWVFKEI